ncbi:hypothetical protein [Treponema sp.]|uniref:hypothetical protein n=1 Tax=Treponema sp. TaxID=166 RepID=UPI00388FE8C0
MITIERTETAGWEAAIRGMRNPMNSWDKSDSGVLDDDIVIGHNDLALMTKLVNSGSDHSKFKRMIIVTADITAPLYWWKEFDTYKVGTVANSCSTMHRIHKQEFTLEDFSTEHLTKDSLEIFQYQIFFWLNYCRERFLETNDKTWWWQMIQILPSSYNQKRTVLMNYEVLSNIYRARKDHKLDEWHDLCRWISSLPYSDLITRKENDND